jgi:thiol-disulfide isomerase/thioredoxin
MRRAAAALAATIASLGAASTHALEAGSPLPAITAPRLAASGAPVSLASLKGQVVYVDFWASWCVPCRLSMPTLDAMYRKYSSKGFAVVGFNKDVSNADAERFLQRVPVSFTLAQDEKDAAAKAFDVKAMPSGYLVDRKGVVRRVHRGFTAETAAELEHEVEELLKEPA